MTSNAMVLFSAKALVEMFTVSRPNNVHEVGINTQGTGKPIHKHTQTNHQRNNYTAVVVANDKAALTRNVITAYGEYATLKDQTKQKMVCYTFNDLY